VTFGRLILTYVPRANIVFIPVMASRLMLSLKKAAVEQTGLWSLPTLYGTSGGARLEDGTLRFASRVPGELYGILEITSPPDDGVIELDFPPKGPRGSD